MATLEGRTLKGTLISIPTIDKTLTKDGAGADAKVTGDELLNRVKFADVVDNLTTYDKYKPLSANMGAELRETIEEVANNGYETKGGMVTGSISTRHYDNGHSTLNKNHSANADYGTQLVDASKDGKQAFLTVFAQNNSLTFTDNGNNIRNIHHEGNKPNGNYTGNGSATQRVINTNGIGKLLIVYTPNNMSFVTPQGAMVISVADGSIKWIEGGKVFYNNGQLNLLLTNDAFNKSGTTYYYQVI